MSDALLYGALLLGALGLVVSRFGPGRLPRIMPGVSWIGLILGFGLQAAGQVTDLRAAIGTALFAGIAVVLGGESDSRRDSLAGASALVLVGAVVAALAVPSSAVATSGHLILVSALFAALIAFAAALVAAAAARLSGRPVGLAIAAGGAVAGGAIAGFLRSSLPQSGYSVPLRTATGEPIYWEMPAVEGLASGLRLSAVLDIPAMPWLVGAAIGFAIVAAALEVVGHSKGRLVAWALVGGCAVGALGVLHVASSEARLPGVQRYEDMTRQVLRDAKADEALLQRASFTGDDSEVVIARSDMAPEFFGYGLALLLALLAVGRRIGPLVREAEDEVAPRLQRDLFLRAAAFGWLAVLSAGLIQFGYFGVAWIGSGSEWSALAVVLVVSGLAIGSFDRHPGRIASTARSLAPGIGAALLFVVLGIAYSFGAPFALSINAY